MAYDVETEMLNYPIVYSKYIWEHVSEKERGSERNETSSCNLKDGAKSELNFLDFDQHSLRDLKSPSTPSNVPRRSLPCKPVCMFFRLHRSSGGPMGTLPISGGEFGAFLTLFCVFGWFSVWGFGISRAGIPPGDSLELTLPCNECYYLVCKLIH